MPRINSTTDFAQSIHVIVDGISLAAIPGESIAGLMFSNNMTVFRQTAQGELRAPYCGMGTCFECRVEVRFSSGETSTLRACVTEAEDGMVVSTGTNPQLKEPM